MFFRIFEVKIEGMSFHCHQKSAQLTEQQHLLLFDTCCLWLHLEPLMEGEFPTSVVERHKELFMKGTLGLFMKGC